MSASAEPSAPAPPGPSPLSEASTWDLVSSGYADILLPEFTKYAQDALNKLAPNAQASVLDVACGPGTLALLAAPVVAAVTAIDFAPAMVQLARSAVRSRQLANVEVHLGDAQRLPFSEAQFDAAFSLFGLIFFPDRRQGLSELYRVLKPNGRLALTSWLPFHDVPVLGSLFATISKHLNTPFGRSGPPPLGTPALIMEELAIAGFENIKVDRIEHTSEAESLDRYWADMVRSSAPLTLLHHRMGDKWAEFEAPVLADLKAQFGSGPISVTAPAWLTIADRL